MWTRFFDMHSGGDAKTDFECIYIEAPKKAAILIFKDIFPDVDPTAEACRCCGDNYSITEFDFDEDYNRDLKNNVAEIKIISSDQFNVKQKALLAFSLITERYF